jgi:hypothetical protein
VTDDDLLIAFGVDPIIGDAGSWKGVEVQGKPGTPSYTATDEERRGKAIASIIDPVGAALDVGKDAVSSVIDAAVEASDPIKDYVGIGPKVAMIGAATVATFVGALAVKGDGAKAAITITGTLLTAFGAWLAFKPKENKS